MFLNLRNERYVGVSGAELECLPTLVPGWPVDTRPGDVPESAERALEAARKLHDAGLLTTDPRSGRAAHPPQLEDAASSLLQNLPDSPSRGSPKHLVLLTCVAITVAAILKFRSLEWTIGRLRRRKAVRITRIGPLEDAGRIAALTQGFFRTRAFVYSSREKCLYDSLVLLEFLAHFKLFPTLVIGVTTFPFRAHCWLQYGSLVLTDYVERTRVFTPILVV